MSQHNQGQNHQVQVIKQVINEQGMIDQQAEQIQNQDIQQSMSGANSMIAARKLSHIIQGQPIQPQPCPTLLIPSQQFPIAHIIQKQPQQFLTKSLFRSFNNPLITQRQQTNHQQKQYISINNKKLNLFPIKSVNEIKDGKDGFLAVNKIYKNQPITNAKRKIKPTKPFFLNSHLQTQEKIALFQNEDLDCQQVIQKKLIKKNSNTNSKEVFYVSPINQWIYNQYFYSNSDRVFFNKDTNPQFTKLLQTIGVNVRKISFKDFKLLKKALPRPKLFNLQMIISQQSRLNEFRQQYRQLPKQRTKVQQSQLSITRQVVSLHPICGHLHTGNILAIYKQNQYMIKYHRPQLGTQKVLDINICTMLKKDNKNMIDGVDFQAMTILIKLLEYKGDLVEKFKFYGGVIQQLRNNAQDIQNCVLQEYGWIGSTINILSMGLKHVLAKFRIRGLNNNNQQIVGKNFSSLLVNPLNLMSKQLQHSNQQIDIQTSNQIKNITSNHSQCRIDQVVQSLCSKNYHLLENSSQMNPQQKSQMQILLQNFLSLLVNLRYDGKNFNIQSNKYLNNILGMIDGQYPQYFNQIYNNIHLIVRRITDGDGEL